MGLLKAHAHDEWYGAHARRAAQLRRMGPARFGSEPGGPGRKSCVEPTDPRGSSAKCRVCHETAAPLVYLGCACSGALAHVGCMERAALEAKGPKAPDGARANRWSVCDECSERYSGDMWVMLGECWYKTVGGLAELDPWRMLATERHIDCLRIRRSFEEAERAALALLGQYRGMYGESHERTLAVAALLGLVLGSSGKHDAALAVFTLVLDGRGGADGPKTIELFETRAHIAHCYLMKGDAERAKKEFLVVAKACEKAFQGRAVSLRIWLMYCDALQRVRTPAALELCKKALSRVLTLAAGGVGADHDVAVRAAYLHSDICFKTATSDDERRAALALMTAAVDSLVRVRGTSAHFTLHAVVRLATRELKAAKAEAAKAASAVLADSALCRLERVLPLMERALGVGHDATLQAATTYGDALCFRGNLERGERVLRRTREVANGAASVPLATRARVAEMHERSLTMLNETLLHHGALVEVRGFQADERSAHNGKRGTIVGNPTPQEGGAVFAVLVDGKTVVEMTAENARAACYYPACTTNGLPLALCGKCESAAYCCKDCQVAHWKNHRGLCAATVALRARS